MSNKYLGPADRKMIAEKWAAYASVREIAALVVWRLKPFTRNYAAVATAHWTSLGARRTTRSWPSVVFRKASDGAESP